MQAGAIAVLFEIVYHSSCVFACFGGKEFPGHFSKELRL